MNFARYKKDNDLDTQMVLAELSFDFIEKSLKSQITHPLSSNQNYIKTIMDKCQLLKEDNEGDLEYIKYIDDEKTEFYLWVIRSINDKFNLNIDLSCFNTYEEIEELAEVVYNFFILDYLDNLKNYIVNYILINKDQLGKLFSHKNKKDVSTLARKKLIKDKAKLAICSNISTLVTIILGEEVSNKKFIELSRDDDYEGNYLDDLNDRGIIVTSFFRAYVDTYMNDPYYSIMDDVISDVRLRILKEYGVIKSA